MDKSQIATLRRFNRTITSRVGVLQENYLTRGRPLGEARVIFEIGRDGADIRDLREKLNLDSGYVSRLVKSLEEQGLLTLQKADDDARVRRAELTPAGLAEWNGYDRSSDELAKSILDPLSANERKRLVGAMQEVEQLLRGTNIRIDVEAPDSVAGRWCLGEYTKELAARFEEGFDPANGNSVSASEMTPPAGYLIVARQDARLLGCAALIRRSGDTAEIKRMWTAPAARGQGLARRMLRRLEEMARDLGFSRLLLDTNRALKEAQALYRAEGYVETERYSDNPYADHWFEKRLA